MMTAQPGDPDHGVTGREESLAQVQRRFTRRWIVGICIGFALAIFNFFGYRSALGSVVDAVDADSDAAAAMERMGWVNGLLSALALVVLSVLAVAFFRPLDRTLRNETRKIARIEQLQSIEAQQRSFDVELHEALEMARDEAAAFRLVASVIERTAPESPGELLLADSSDAHLSIKAVNPVAGGAGCSVSSPFDCPAVRRARPVTFLSSTAVNACPHLRDRPGEARSAHCVPLAFMGRSMGVLHLTGPDGEGPDTSTTARMAAVANQLSTHIGTVRAFATAQLQASTDSLTGLSNRRSGEVEISRRLETGELVAVAMADLDNFKTLNDTYGHDAGDRALRLFADTVRKALRSQDLVARWGGEEFVIAFPGMDQHRAAEALDRVRLALVDACVRAETPTITASFGVADTSAGRSLDRLLRIADEGLMLAKQLGKDQVRVSPVVGAEPDQPSNTTVLRP